MKKTTLAFALFIASLPAFAEEPFTGMYQSGGVDSVSQLMLMDNQKFCFALSAGSLDMLTGGSWQKITQDENHITLQLTEQKMPLSDVVVIANPQVDESTLADAQKETGSKRVLFFTAPALENALGTMNPLIGFSHTTQFSGKLKPAYQESNGGTPMYVHLAIPQNARYLFIGSIPNQKLYRFHIGNSQAVKLNPNEQAGRNINIALTFDLKTNQLEEFGQPQKVSLKDQQQTWQICQPQVKSEIHTSVQGKERTLLNAEAIEPLPTH